MLACNQAKCANSPFSQQTCWHVVGVVHLMDHSNHYQTLFHLWFSPEDKLMSFTQNTVHLSWECN